VKFLCTKIHGRHAVEDSNLVVTVVSSSVHLAYRLSFCALRHASLFIESFYGRCNCRKK
jgi:hypothetical protein